MSPDLEQRILALAAGLGARDPRIVVCPTTGPGSKSWRKGVEVRVLSGNIPPDSADGASEEAAGERMLRTLRERARNFRDAARSRAESCAAEADRLDAALTAAGVSL